MGFYWNLSKRKFFLLKRSPGRLLFLHCGYMITSWDVTKIVQSSSALWGHKTARYEVPVKRNRPLKINVKVRLLQIFSVLHSQWCRSKQPSVDWISHCSLRFLHRIVLLAHKKVRACIHSFSVPCIFSSHWEDVWGGLIFLHFVSKLCILSHSNAFSNFHNALSSPVSLRLGLKF